MSGIKAITLYQPWATLIAIGAKSYETRGWRTEYRGPMAIHAGEKWTCRMALHCYEEPFFTLLSRAGIRFPARCDGTKLQYLGLPFGAILAVADLVDVAPAAAVLPQLGPQERAFGDFSHGRYAWQYENVRRLPHAIPCPGKQGLWELPERVHKLVMQMACVIGR